MKSFLNRDYIENFVRYHKKIIFVSGITKIRGMNLL